MKYTYTWLWAFYLGCLLLLALTGCMTEKNLPRHNDKFPLAAAKYAADKFPCLPGDSTIITITDSTGFNAQRDSLGRIIDSLILQPEDTVRMPGDTLCDQYRFQLASMRSQLRGLRTRLQNIKPVIEYREKRVEVPDTRRENYLRKAYEEEKKKREQFELQASEWKGKAKSRFWMLIAVIALIVLYAGVRAAKVFNRIPLTPNAK
jgi:hypothetical protein